MKLELYYFPQCPYCQKVLRAMEQLNLSDISLKNIKEDSQALEKLRSDTGRQTVPCLYINNKPMHESDDIVNWLTQNQEQIK